jgi:hypothetical protein
VPQPVVDVQALHEPPEGAFGDGGGIVLVATTSTGCLLGAFTAWLPVMTGVESSGKQSMSMPGQA